MSILEIMSNMLFYPIFTSQVGNQSHQIAFIKKGLK